MKTISLKLTDEMAAQLDLKSRQVGNSKSGVIREALMTHLSERKKKSRPSCLDLVHDLVGTAGGPGDLASNKRHLLGYGRGKGRSEGR